MSSEAQRSFAIVHRLTRRIRLLAPPLVRNAERCYILEILLRKRPEISEVRAVPEAKE
jgi:Cu+-exporting ATPase